MQFKDAPIQRKLMVIILLTTIAALVLMRGVFFALEYRELQQSTKRQLETVSQVLAANSTAALAFDNQDDAREVLAALKAEEHVTAAALYDRGGKLFARYPASLAENAFPAAPGDPGFHFQQMTLTGFQPVLQRDKQLGTLYIKLDASDIISGWIQSAVAIALIVMIFASVLAYQMSKRLQKQILHPISDLARTAEAITTRQDFSVRANKHGSDEIGQLTDGFNQMLSGIQERETALKTSNETLRGEVAERKHAEDRVQSQLARLELLQHITRAIGERLDLSSIFQVVVRTVEDQLPVDFCCVCLYEPGTNTLSVVSVGVHSETFAMDLAMKANARLEVDENGIGKCVSGRLVYEPDVGESKFPFPQRLAKAGLRALVAAPLLVESKVFGVLLAARCNAASFSSGECEFLRQLSEHVALAAHQSQLHSALQQAYDDLRQTQQAIMQQERLRALGQMASGIAHDINNAISPVALYTESLLENEPNLSPRARDYLGTIQHAIEDVAETVARMREFYRQREPQLATVPVKLNILIQQVLDLSRVRWSDMPQQRGIFIEMKTELAEALPVVLGSESEIREALLNLVFNAVDAMPEGGKLTLRTKSFRKQGEPGSSTTDCVAVEISDTGIGMDEDTRRRCLEPFFTTKGERGTGLGLAMVYGIAQRHGADIEIDSAVGKGTTMRLIFPVAPASQPAAAAPAAPSAPASRLRILIVDDDPVLLKSLRDALETDGHVVVAANGGQAGIDTFVQAKQRGEPFSVVISDLGMPYVDGRKVADAVKGASPSTPLLLLTGWGQRLVAEGDIPPNVDRVLNKPPKLRDLREALAQIRPAAKP